jgi:hypothetical protein
VDHVSAAPAPDGERISPTLTLTLELDPPVALDLVMKVIGAVTRAQGLDQDG